MDADPTRLAQVFANLLNNAAKYTEPGGQHLADRRAAGQRGRGVACGTTGIGIPPDMLPSVFEMFTQVDRHAGAVAGRAGHRPDAGASGWSRCTAAAVEARSEGPGTGQRVRRPPAGRRWRPPEPQPAGGDDGRRAASDAAASWSWTTTGTRPTAWRMMLELMGNEVRDGPRRPGGGGRGGGVPARRGPARHRPAEAERLRGVPAASGSSRGARAWCWSPLTGWGQEEDRRRSQEAGFDSPPGQAGRARRPGEAAGEPEG